jgi:site-specific recombinase XerD
VLMEKRILSRSEIKDYLFGRQLTRRTKLRDYVLTKLESANLSQTTKNKYKGVLNKFERFKPNLTLEEITTDVLNQFLLYQRDVLGNEPNTYYKSLAIIKGFLTWTVEDGILAENPAKRIKIKRFEGKRDFLTMDEVNILLSLYNSDELSKPKKNVLRYFLFSCFTGLRYSDIKELKGKHLSPMLINGKEVIVLQKRQHKTKEIVKIPLPDIARALLPEQNHDDFPVFQVRAGQVTNRRLKEIMKLAGIEKNITFHSARHTFATLANAVGISGAYLSKLIGHTDLKTTMIYIGSTESLLNNEIEKINAIFSADIKKSM